MSGPFTAGHKVFNTDLNPILLGWVDLLAWYGTTLAYVSADSPTFVFSIDADVTAVIEPGMRVKLTQTTDKFFIVTAVGAFSAGHTQITVYGGTDYTLANAAITAGSFSTHKKPYGFNASPIKWTETLRDTSDRVASSPVSGTWLNPSGITLSAPIGLWSLEYEAPVFVDSGSSTTASVRATLSTANNSESDSDFTTALQIEGGGLTGTDITPRTTLYRRKTVLVATKTSYFLNAKTTVASVGNIGFSAATLGSPTIIRAVCAYL